MDWLFIVFALILALAALSLLSSERQRKINERLLQQVAAPAPKDDDNAPLAVR